MKKNRYLILRIITLFFILTLVMILIYFRDFELLTAMKDSLIIMAIVTVWLFAKLDKDKIKKDELKAYNEGYEQGIKYGKLNSKEKKVTSDVD